MQATGVDGNAVTYEVEGNLAPDGAFTVDANTGWVMQNQALDRDYPAGYDNWQVRIALFA